MKPKEKAPTCDEISQTMHMEINFAISIIKDCILSMHTTEYTFELTWTQLYRSFHAGISRDQLIDLFNSCEV